MKIEDQPTEWVLVRTAMCPPETPVDYVLFHLTKTKAAILREQYLVQTDLTETAELFCISFHCRPYAYFQYNYEGIDGHLGRRLLDWAFISFEDADEMKSLKKVTLPFTKQYISYYTDTARFYGETRDNDQLFITREFPLDYILECLGH